MVITVRPSFLRRVKSNSAELDYLAVIRDKIFPIEVKI